MKHLFLLFSTLSLLLSGCSFKKKADLLVTNARIYTADSSFSMANAFAIKDGKFLAVGDGQTLAKEYEAATQVDLAGQPVYPGFYDPHAHFLGLGQVLDQADLVGAESYDEVINRLKTFYQAHPNVIWLTGRGWDQNDWPEKVFPTKEKLDEAFPNVPVALTRIDGHALLVNSKALRLANVTGGSQVAGGEVVLDAGQPTGVLVDNAMQFVKRVIPRPDASDKARMLLNAEKACVALGLTTVSDAGISPDEINLIDSLQQAGKLKIRDYAMVSLGEPNLNYFLKRGPFQTDRLTVRSFKLYADGALGSRGACLRKPYSDRPETSGFLLLSPSELERVTKLLYNSKFQANTHCIGDSANHLMLDLYGRLLEGKNNRRWRIEHAQVVSPEDVWKFGRYSIIPSVQPTHATSDMYWAGDRLGAIRVKGAYAFNDLMKQNSLIAFGSDFPVEAVNPLFGFHAAVARQDAKNYPAGGYQMENAVDRKSALLAMTRWAAYACFEDHLRGCIAPGKQADFVILDQDIMLIPNPKIRQTKVRQTWINGERVF
ncbi:MULTISPECIES: amidohydrolase family protein [unclassified Spirosoma]|uniref:amidohydrolase n=1 Tax=unclassified Spirosoma TaxID=2621999 RepID=UPI00095DACD1|nr:MULTISPECIES: amidohydrolase family protein [unclassified Spirosoma]MBN8823918.1 amidohydrolase [Spirosoma sp.]OJW79691.1 MAG: amidohydrolase [Spirosoma sp. 48-14]